jgi:hypothetical protein
VLSCWKLLRMMSVILYFQIGCSLVGVSFGKSFTMYLASSAAITRNKRSVFNSWSAHLISLSVSLREECGISCIISNRFLFGIAFSSIQSRFSQVSALVNDSRLGIGLICPRHLYILCYWFCFSTSLSVKRMNCVGTCFLIRALIAG